MEQQHIIIISSALIETPVGQMIAYASKKGICLLEFTDRKNLEKQKKNLKVITDINIGEKHNPHIELLKKELSAYFEGNLTRFSVSLDMVGTDFQKKVWSELLTIPYGKIISYIQQARSMNSESAVRAIANANGANKIAIIIPCHRVIGANKTLTGYAGGLERKRFLLNLESAQMNLFNQK